MKEPVAQDVDDQVNLGRGYGEVWGEPQGVLAAVYDTEAVETSPLLDAAEADDG